MNRLLVSLLVSSCLVFSGCTTVSNWFYDEDEIEIRRLKPIQTKFIPVQKWSVDLGDGVGNFFSKLKPAVNYSKVFAADRQGMIAAFEQETGKQVWQRNLATYKDEGLTASVKKLWSSGIPAKIAGGVTVAYETVFIGTENGEVIALDANSGDQKWIATVKGEVLASPAVDAGVVVVNTGSGFVFALNAADGEELWSHESDVPPLSLRGVSAPSAGNGGAIIGTATGKLIVNILDSGQSAWEQVISAATGVTELERIVDIDSKPLVANGIIYVVSYDGTLAAVEMRSGRIIWKREYKSYRSLSISGSSLFVVDNNSYVYALDTRNGVELWSQGALKKRLLTAATPVGNYVVAGDKYGYLHWFDKTDGTIVARLEVGGDDDDESIYSAPIADGNMLYTQTRDGKLVAIETP
ncbi:outer membrane protein assembly factor BamB [Paraglaciecola aquimarina]|uniref:Outer membrane protein assembly factor BamB n=1 Tax=Paraglaciecola algarum TaxID=3050085 RepID=A0ABS9D1S1_9ALTE|nr:outer membrane protein assembly factor BamB [Paraglaciecola sp. G1-23]